MYACGAIPSFRSSYSSLPLDSFSGQCALCTSDVDHRVTVEGRTCGNDEDGIKSAIVSVWDTLAGISVKGILKKEKPKEKCGIEAFWVLSLREAMIW